MTLNPADIEALEHLAVCMGFGCNHDMLRRVAAALRASPPVDARREEIARAANEIVSRVSEWDDRTSPEDWPEALLITADELREELHQFAAAILALCADTPLSRPHRNPTGNIEEGQ